MKKNVNYVDAAKFELVIREKGLEMLAQAGFVKVQGPKGRQLYVARTKRVGRVDLSGFTMPEGTTGIVELGEDLSFGNVKQQLDFSLPEDQILAAFGAILDHMKTLAPVEKAARKAPTQKKDDAQGWSSSVPAAPTKEERKAALIAANKKAKAKKEEPASSQA